MPGPDRTAAGCWDLRNHRPAGLAGTRNRQPLVDAESGVGPKRPDHQDSSIDAIHSDTNQGKRCNITGNKELKEALGNKG